MKVKNVIKFISCLGILFFASCSNKNAGEAAPEPAKTAVTVIEPITQGFTDYIQLNGNTRFQNKLTIRANITGYLISMKWKTGDKIVNGTLFCSIKTKEQDALKNIDSREPSLKQFQTPIQVFANTSGIITMVNYSAGDLVNEGDVLATITDPASMVLVVNVPYEYHDYVYKGKGCTVKFPDGRTIPATIQEESPFIDSASQTQSFLIRFPGNQLLPEKMNLMVMKLVNDSLAIKVPVTPGLQNDSLREIISGVSLTDKIIVKGAYGLTDSSLVKLQNEKDQ
ncbi:MAG: HlyD family efflux transporter periplasmic adaptor subunit [Chitinophagaceae bacterium]|nr:HlyD family efflux transporter periplasmic adaptor subunit [Chitinophagaceae bacterium]